MSGAPCRAGSCHSGRYNNRFLPRPNGHGGHTFGVFSIRRISIRRISIRFYLAPSVSGIPLVDHVRSLGISKLYHLTIILLPCSSNVASAFIYCGFYAVKGLLPPKKTTDYVLRNSENSYVLPQCKLSVFKRSFINWSLFML